MRENKRGQILSAALRVVEDRGVTAVTFDAVAAEAGLTRGGVMYHFPSREDLLAALHEHQARLWEESLEAAAGKSADEATADERSLAYARACSQSATKAELRLLLEAGATPEHHRQWAGVIDRWASQSELTEETLDDEEQLARFVARLAVDGLWLYDSISSSPLPAKARDAVTAYLTRSLSAPAGDVAAESGDR